MNKSIFRGRKRVVGQSGDGRLVAGNVNGERAGHPWVWRARFLERGNRNCTLDDHAKKWHLIVMEVVGNPGKFCGEDLVTCPGQACVLEDELGRWVRSRFDHESRSFSGLLMGLPASYLARNSIFSERSWRNL